MPSEATVDSRPPYISLTTLINFLDRLGAGPIPPRIDKSALDTYSGGVQAILMVTLRAMEFVSEDGQVQATLREAATDEELRKAHLRAYALRTYPRQFELAEENGTAQMLQESFAEFGFAGSTMRKAIVFYLSLVDYLGLPKSPHFRAPKQPPSTGARARRRTQAAPAEERLSEEPSHAGAPPAGETRVFELGAAGKITLIVEARWLDLDLATLSTIRTAITNLEELAKTFEEPDGWGTAAEGDAE